MKNIKKFLNLILSKYPHLFIKILKLRKKFSSEKIAFLSIINKNETVIDIGANLGNLSMLFSNIVGKNGHIYSIEANPSTFKLLSFNVNGFSNKNINIHNFAATEKVGQLEIYQPGTDHGQASLRIQEGGAWNDENNKIQIFKIEGKPIDDFVLQNHIQKIDFVKIDIEGAEFEALKGMRKLIEKYRPVFFLEICPMWTVSFGYHPKDISQFLNSMGYDKFFILDENLVELNLKEINLQESYPNGSVNMICMVEKIHSKKMVVLKETFKII